MSYISRRLLLTALAVGVFSSMMDAKEPIVSGKVVFAERGGLLADEAIAATQRKTANELAAAEDG